MKKGFIILLTFVTILAPYSCEDSTLFVDCNECYQSISEKVSIVLKITIDEENTSVPIKLYKGDIDNGEIISTDTAQSDIFYTQELEVGESYSAIAKYSRDGRIIYAVDGRKLRKKYIQNSCDEPCYILEGDVLNLRLK